MNEANQEKESAAEEKLIDDMAPLELAPKSGAALEGNSDMGNAESSSAPNEKGSEGKARQPDDSQDELTVIKAELTKYKDIALRAVADLDNYRKRMAREKDDAIRYANSSFLERLIPILDNFELGLQAAKVGGGQSAVQDGMMMVFKQLQDFLASSGVETIDATGQHFDPNLHEAIAQEENAEVAEGFVVRQLRKGYRLKDRLLRPANVVVSKGAPVTEATLTPGAGT
ncbi:MAG: nucleotide exchange factor GrpE [Verrucomicrobia bacterium]|nr:nucleotide exchange factor GrpE [Verrucomicrobiota bacterium]MBV8376576.1 nucleotide exchange factor GrpE [Verrucomicrobiota bacterium]